MKKTPILTLILGLFILTLGLAVVQEPGSVQVHQAGISHAVLMGVSQVTLGLFDRLFIGLVSFMGQNLFLSLIVLALIVELILLYPSVTIQLKQKKIHLFHKKLVDRFRSGQLTLSKSQQELNVLYAVNEKMHRRGALLFMVQLLVFVCVVLGLQQLALARPEHWGPLSHFDLTLLARSHSFMLPLCVASAYFLHSIIKVVLKNKEDYIAPWQSRLSVFIALVLSFMVFTFSASMPLLLSVYMIHLITFSTLRYCMVEWNSKAWGKAAHRELIGMLIHTPVHKNTFQKIRTQLNHSVFARHFNLHLLEEAASMSLVVALMLTYV